MDAHLTFTLPRGKRLHLGICGSIAAYKAADLIHPWRDCGLGLSATLTEAACRFISPLTFEALGAAPVYTGMFSGQSPFEHLEPGQIAGAMLIAPASADCLARLAQGRANDMLSAQALAFDGPLVLAPAMNPRMFSHPATQANLDILEARGATIISPDCGLVACGDEGEGKLADLRMIFLAGLKALTGQDMEGQTIMLTIGPTREGFDDVRYWTNGSTGTMGASLAVAAWLRGANVHAVCGPMALWLPDDPNFTRHDVISAADMLDAAQSLWPKANAGIFSAAVADFRPEPYGPGKFKKKTAEDGFGLKFLPNQDILRLLAADRAPRQKVVGFAAESVPGQDALAHAVRRKLLAKGADMIVGNQIADGFCRASNKVFVADVRGREEHWPDLPKTAVAWKILDWLHSLN